MAGQAATATAPATVGQYVDLASSATAFLGRAAQALLTGDEVAAPLVSMMALLVPAASPVAAAMLAAEPILADIARYAPAVSAAVTTGKPLIEAVAGNGPVFSSLVSLIQVAAKADGIDLSKFETELAMVQAFIGGMFARNFFTPQDTRFNRADYSHEG